MGFDFDGEKVINEDGSIKQYLLRGEKGRFKCDCGCNVFSKFKELYRNEEIFKCNVCHSCWGGK